MKAKIHKKKYYLQYKQKIFILIKDYPINTNIFLKYLWGIERSGFFNGREKWAKGFENQRV